MKVSIVSYGSGNIRSVYKAISDIGYNPVVCDSPKNLKNTDKIILPGVGSYYQCMKLLANNNWVETILDLVKVKKKPIFGICLGMQLFSKCSYEGGYSEGLNLINAEIHSLKELGCKKIIPHMGWNTVIFNKENILFEEVNPGSDFYFAHSYAFKDLNKDYIAGTVNYDVPVVAAISVDNIYGTQFHPEKSSISGKKILKNFLKF
jgi:glutamine amidotransferase